MEFGFCLATGESVSHNAAAETSISIMVSCWQNARGDRLCANEMQIGDRAHLRAALAIVEMR
jgi:hypothetical protein